MTGILDLVAHHRRQEFGPGEVVLEQGQRQNLLFVLLEGEVEVVRDDVRVARAAEPGAVFGEMSALLGSPFTATVRTLKASTFAVVEDPLEFLRGSPEVSLHVARLLARRLEALNRYLIDVKIQYEGHDHLGMVDSVLDTLMHRHPRPQPKS